MAVQIPLFVSRPRPWINSISCRIDRPDPGKLEPVVGSQQLTDGTINFFPCFGLYERLVDLSNRLIGSVQGGELLVLLLECTVLFTELRLRETRSRAASAVAARRSVNSRVTSSKALT